MKKTEWDRRIPFDVRGVGILGCALLIRAKNRKQQAAQAFAVRKAAEEGTKPRSPFELVYDVQHYEREFRNWERECRDLELYLSGLELTTADRERAKEVRFKDFRYRWDILMQHKVLLGYIMDDVPDWAKPWDRETPIAELYGDNGTKAMTQVFYSEYRRVTGFEPDDVPYLRTDEEFFFHLGVWHLCEPERGKGQPTGRRWPDGLHYAASYAWTIREKAAEEGEPISNSEAIRQALAEFEVISSKDFSAYANKDQVIVSDAADEDGPVAGAEKAIRKALNEIDDQENNTNA